MNHIDDLVLKYLLKEELNEQELLEVKQWIASDPRREQWVRDHQNSDFWEGELIHFGNLERREDIWNRLQQKQSVAAKHQIGKRYLFAAACVVMFMVFAGIYVSRSHKVLQPVIATVKHDASPGKSRAILTLGDGSKVYLDSVGNGLVSKQGSVDVVKADSAMLSYQTSGTITSVAYNVVETPKAAQFSILLPDGSRVFLNNASSLRFPTAFTGTERVVELTGEAYFEVAKNQHMPFKVRLPNMEVEVLGTHFDVNAYTDEKETKTTLLEGSVRILSGNKTALLVPNDQASVGAPGSVNVKHDMDAAETISWKNGYFHFNGDNLTSVMRQLARWYDVTVVYKGTIPDRTFSGKIQRNLSLVKVLKGLGQDQIHFSIDNNVITINP